MHFINLEKKRVLCWQISSTSVWVEIAVQLCNESHNKPEPPHALFCCGVSGDYPGLWLVQYCTVQNLPEIKKGGGGQTWLLKKKPNKLLSHSGDDSGGFSQSSFCWIFHQTSSKDRPEMMVHHALPDPETLPTGGAPGWLRWPRLCPGCITRFQVAVYNECARPP